METDVRITVNGEEIGPMPWDRAVLRCCGDDVPPDAIVSSEHTGTISVKEFLGYDLLNLAEGFLYEGQKEDFWIRRGEQEEGPMNMRSWFAHICDPNTPLNTEARVGKEPYRPLFATLQFYARLAQWRFKEDELRKSSGPVGRGGMKTAGWLLIIAAVIVIGYNVFVVPEVNEQIVKEHPFQTLVSGGANLKQGYTFKPPYQPFEVLVMAMGVLGVVFLMVARPNP